MEKMPTDRGELQGMILTIITGGEGPFLNARLSVKQRFRSSGYSMAIQC
jgi:hypothetical protein